MNARKAADRWARDAGFADFDTYFRAGGSIVTARRDIFERMRSLHELIEWLDSQPAPPQDPKNPNPVQVRPNPTEVRDDDEPPDPHNAHIQGAEEP